MHEEGTHNIDRRTLIKRAGAGAAILWAAPAVTSLGSHALAQRGSEAGCGGNCPGCTFAQCGGQSCGDLGPCFCVGTDPQSGDCFCSNNFFCGDTPDCVSAADCPEGWVCQLGECAGACGPGVCVPPCGTCAGGAGASLTRTGPTNFAG